MSTRFIVRKEHRPIRFDEQGRIETVPCDQDATGFPDQTSAIRRIIESQIGFGYCAVVEIPEMPAEQSVR